METLKTEQICSFKILTLSRSSPKVSIIRWCLHIKNAGTIIGGLSPRRIRRRSDRIRSDPIGSDRIRSDPPTSPPERPPRRTQADSGGPKKSPPSPPESAADPIVSDRIRHQLADGPPEKDRCSVGWQKTRPESANWRT